MWNQRITIDASRDYSKLAGQVKDFIKEKFVEPYYQKIKQSYCKMIVNSLSRHKFY